MVSFKEEMNRMVKSGMSRNQAFAIVMNHQKKKRKKTANEKRRPNKINGTPQ